MVSLRIAFNSWITPTVMAAVTAADHIPKGVSAVIAVDDADAVDALAALQRGVDGDFRLVHIAAVEIQLHNAAGQGCSSTGANRGP